MAEVQKQRGNKRGLFLTIIGVLVALNGALFYLNHQNQDEAEKQGNEVKKINLQLKSTSHSLDSIKHELELKIEEVTKLGGDVTSLHEMIKQLENDKARLQRAANNGGGNSGEMKALKQRIEEYVAQLTQRDEEIEKLKQERDAIFNESKNLKNQIVQREDSLMKLVQSKNEMADKLNSASVLRADALKITTLDSKGKEKDEKEYKGKKIDKVKVAFTIADNKVAKLETKDVYLRMLEPDGATLMDLAQGGGKFTVAGKELDYTSKQSFLFDNKQPRLLFVWGKGGGSWKSGEYPVEIYCEGNIIGTGSFRVK